VSLLDQLRKFQFSTWTAGCGTARPVVWEDGSREAPSYPIKDHFLSKVELFRNVPFTRGDAAT